MTQRRSRATAAATVAVAAAAAEISVAEIKRRIGNRVPRVPGKDNTLLDNPPLISKKQISAAGMKFSAALVR